MSANVTRVYILGAGCSVCGGYPLASEVPRALDQFAEELGNNFKAQKLKECVEKTVRLLRDNDVTTTDQLARKLRGDRRDEIEMSKKAMSALFFHLENDAVAKAMPHYSALFEELFENGENPDLRQRIFDHRMPCAYIQL